MNKNLQQLLIQVSQVFTAPLFQMEAEKITLLWIFRLFFYFLIVAFFTRIIKRIFKNRLLGKLGIDAGNREAIATLISYSLGAIGYVIAMQASGINLATFAVIIGGLGIGIGFGLQNITNNLVSGLTLLLERKLKVGDFIEFENLSGHIEEISIRAAVLRTLDGNAIIIPNSKLSDNKILNKSYSGQTEQLKIPIKVAYGSDPVLVTEVLLNSAYMEDNILNDPPPKVIFIGFGDSALNFEVWAWIAQIEQSIITKSSLNFILEYNLRLAGLKIPFPQQEIYLSKPHQLQIAPSSEDETADTLAILPTSFFLRDLLRQVTYFQFLNELQLRSLIEMGYRKSLKESEILYRQGDPGNAFCIVLSGAIEAIYQQAENQTHLFTFSTGQFFGEIPLLLGTPYPTTMQAVSETILFMINHQGFSKLYQSCPRLAESIVQELAKRKEVIEEHQKQLKVLGLIHESDESKNPVNWLRKRLKKMFVMQA